MFLLSKVFFEAKCASAIARPNFDTKLGETPNVHIATTGALSLSIAQPMGPKDFQVFFIYSRNSSDMEDEFFLVSLY